MSDCKQCKSSFEITDEDRKFYSKIDVPEPTLCPECRLQRRLAWRNESNLYSLKCDLCNKNMITCYNGDYDSPVYCKECWWSDNWDPRTYGRDFDFSRPFFEQYDELLKVVPKMGQMQLQNENCPYANWLAYSKNVYMSPGSYFLEDCLYLWKSQRCKDVVDGNFLNECEIMYSCIHCSNCYNGQFLNNCRNCSDSTYLSDCVGCKKCFMCSGLSGQKYCIKNHQLSKEDYEKQVEEYMKKNPQELATEFAEFNKTIPKKYQNNIACENSVGDYLQNCKNAQYCFDCFDIEDCKYLDNCVAVKDSIDLTDHDKDIELCYEIMGGGESNREVKFSSCPVASPFSEYLNSCFNLSNGFGCDGFHSKSKFCILNKQYSESEYKEMRLRIIKHMKGTGEWGEFFPITLSPFAYNESIAYEYFPLINEEVLNRGCRWKDFENKVKNITKTIPASRLPDNINDVPDDILNWAIECEETGRLFKLQPHELKFYRRFNIPVPHFHPEVRHTKLNSLRNPRKIYKRKCDKCQCDIQTTYAPERQERIYCESCYLKEVY
ncbi:zinc-ribbon domain containing protein [Candidatus Peregrinibacteria bacterium]|nr:zinc-ribbon domain containing protein [Candidatus Peregrinibacteria bacterium]